MSGPRLVPCIFFLLLGSIGAAAAVIHVPGDQPTIQQGIDAAVGGDTVLVADGTWTGPGNRELRFNGKAITVISGGGPEACIIDCGQSSRGVIFDGGEGPASVLEGFTVTGAYDSTGQGGGIICYGSSPTLTDLIIAGNESSAAGGGIACHAASPTIDGCTVNGNTAGWSGGGIACLAGSSPEITDCSINGNEAGVDGGGLYCEEASSPVLTTCTVSGNLSAGNGGGICGSTSSPVFSGCQVVENTVEAAAEASGGGLHFDWGAPRLADCLVARNTVNAAGSYNDAYGGGLSIRGGVLTISGCDVEGNLLDGADYGCGGGLSCRNAELAISGNRLTKNDVRTARYQYGGGIYSYQCDGEISDNVVGANTLLPDNPSSYHGYGAGIYTYGDGTRIEGNIVRRNRMDCDYGAGGGICCYSSTNAIIANEILENTVDCYRGYGGGLNVDDSLVWIDGNTVTGNRLITSSSAYGGGIYCESYARSISWNTITDNIVDAGGYCYGGGLYVYYSSPVMIGNTISGNVSTCSSTGRGGGIFFDYSGNSRPARIEGSLIEHNTIGGAGSLGGGIYCEDATLYVVQSRIAYNTCSLDGGGVFFDDDGPFGPPEVKNSELVSNIADRDGGGFFAQQNRPLLRNVLISGNKALRNGGGVCAEDVALAGSTITGNDAPLGPALYSATGEVEMTDCIAWFNSSGAIYVQGGVPQISYSNLEGGFIGEGNIEADPLFVEGPGGSHYLSQVAAGQAEDSPCIDAGSAAADAVGLATKTTRTDEAADAGMVDMGYHPYGQPQHVLTDISVWPSRGTLPFSTKFQITMRNASDFPRAFAGRVDLALGNGGVISGWRHGYTNLQAGDAYYTGLLQPLNILPSLVGDNRCRIVVQDVTPAPYNQPPYPTSGQEDTDLVTVHAAAGTFTSELVCTPASGTLPFSGTNCIEVRNVTDFNRRYAFRVRAYWGGGGGDYYHQTGTMDVGSHQLESHCWDLDYVDGTHAGENEFVLYTRDVTPAPYNQPPYPPSGHYETHTVTVTGIEP